MSPPPYQEQAGSLRSQRHPSAPHLGFILHGTRLGGCPAKSSDGMRHPPRSSSSRTLESESRSDESPFSQERSLRDTTRASGTRAPVGPKYSLIETFRTFGKEPRSDESQASQEYTLLDST